MKRKYLFSAAWLVVGVFWLVGYFEMGGLCRFTMFCISIIWSYIYLVKAEQESHAN